MDTVFGPAQTLDERDQKLIDAYERTSRSVDDLPYTDEFDRLYDKVQNYDPHLTKADVFKRLLTLRKAARLPRLGRALSPPTHISINEEELLGDLVPLHAGTLGQRDRLPYTRQFDSIVDAFNRDTGRNLSHHQIWRLMARIAK